MIQVRGLAGTDITKVCVVRNIRCVMLCLFLLFGITAGALAQDTSCDHQIMDAMESKAWLHGQRRVAQNANLIFKPDSVLEYSCFDRFLGHIAVGGGRRFSEGDGPWGTITSNSSTSLDIAVIQTSFLPLLDYLDNNFRHTFLGGRSVAPSTPPPPYGSYTCDAMAYVWRIARCMNFMDEQAPNDTAFDGFYDFPFYNTTDPRIFPPEMAACTPPAAPEDIASRIAAAYNNQQQYYVLQTENPLTLNSADTTPYATDPILLHLPFMLAGDCSNAAIIPTGVKVERNDLGTAYDEKICSIPACSYDYTADECIR